MTKSFNIVVAGTFGIRGEEFSFIKEELIKNGMNPFMVHTGIHDPLFKPDIDNTELAKIGGADLEKLLADGNLRKAQDAISQGLRKVVVKLYGEDRLDGIISLGGSSDTATITSAMRLLPIGVPKLMITTMAAVTVSEFVDTSDIIMMPSIVNADGMNSISRRIYTNAVNAISGMVGGLEKESTDNDKKRIAVSVFSLTNPCVREARHYLEDKGYEVMEFSCTGVGGRTMERLINKEMFCGVLDLTTTEWCDELFGGILSAGPTRLDAAIINRIPQVVSVGATDMVNFGSIQSVPVKYARRQLYRHNANVTLMRTTAVECAKIGDVLADKWNNAHANMVVMLPLKGVSQLDASGQPFDDPDARQAMFDAIKEHIYNPRVKIEEFDLHINDKAFADAAAQRLIELMEKKK